MTPPFPRTSCSCVECIRCCKRQPGPLVEGDFERIQAHLGVDDAEMRKLFCASPGALVKLAEGSVHRVGSIVPRMTRGRCVFLDENDRCKIHAVAPFGCAFFDTHMSAVTAHPRSIWMVRQNLTEKFRKLRDSLPYAMTYKPARY
jgi:Fe-S-cluster containining protein